MALQLFLNLDTGTVSSDQAGTLTAPINLNQGDNLAVWLWFTRTVNTVARTQVVPLPSPYSLITLAGRPTTSFAAPVLELFDTSSWTAVTADDGTGTMVTHYEGVLNLQSDTLNTWINAATALSAPVFFSITLTDGGTGIWTPLMRGNAILFQELHIPGSVDTTSVPTDYPAADQIAPIAGLNFRFHYSSGFYLQLKNSSTGAYHNVHIEGPAGSEVLVIETAS